MDMADGVELSNVHISSFLPSLVPISKFRSTRRSFLSVLAALSSTVVAGAVGATETTTSRTPPSLTTTFEDDATEQQRIKLRDRLLELISSTPKSSKQETEDEILDVIKQLTRYDPTKGQGATDRYKSDLDGEWKLIWSIKADAFSPLLKLPPPFRPMSYQYLGEAAASEVGPNRVAQGLTGGSLLGRSQIWLSSGVQNDVDSEDPQTIPSPGDPSILDILPPFRLQVGGRYGTKKPKVTIVQAGSDAEFRKLNARTAEAQAAPKNSYKQLYVERTGTGSLRISTITDGDPVIVGAIFVHEKM